MGKAYLYKGKKYSNDYWKDTKDNIFDGDLYNLLDELAEDSEETKLEKHTYTFFTLDGEKVADENDLNEEELLEEMFDSGYLDNVKITKLPTEDDMPNIVEDKTNE